MIKRLNGFALLLAGTFLCCLLSSCDALPETPPVGSQVKLHTPNSKPLPVAVDEKTLSDAINAARAKDEYATNEMLAAGKIFTVADNTKALIIGSKTGAANVRILDGQYEGKAGWVIVEWIK